MVSELRSGHRAAVLTTRRVDASAATTAVDWADPYSSFVRADAETYVPTSGFAAGLPFTIVTGPGVTPHAWGVAGGLVVTVGGDLGVAQIKAGLESLRA